ncbi:hypothetical protein ABPG74_001286 [Tetrahymena malaccensis]
MSQVENNKIQFYYPSKYGAKSATAEYLDASEDAQKKIESGNLVHIPFISKTCYTVKEESEKVKFEASTDSSVDPRYVYQRYDLIFNTYYQFLQQLIAEKKFDEKDLRKYLLVKLLVTKAVHLNAQFAQIGKALSIVQDKATAESIREKAYKYEKTIGFYSENKHYKDSDLLDLQGFLDSKVLLGNQYYSAPKDQTSDINGILAHKTRNINPQTNRHMYYTRKEFYYYNLESIRVTNLAIDEIIAQQRDANNTYDVDFTYLNEDKEAVKVATQVYSLVIDVSLDKLKKEANLTDDILNAAKKVAKVLVESHKLYIQSKKGVANMTDKFYERYYNLYQNPIQGDYVYIPTEIQPLAYIYLNAMLTNKNINKIDE